jgi:hypothetical protein
LSNLPNDEECNAAENFTRQNSQHITLIHNNNNNNNSNDDDDHQRIISPASQHHSPTPIESGYMLAPPNINEACAVKKLSNENNNSGGGTSAATEVLLTTSMVDSGVEAGDTRVLATPSSVVAHPNSIHHNIESQGGTLHLISEQENSLLLSDLLLHQQQHKRINNSGVIRRHDSQRHLIEQEEQEEEEDNNKDTINNNNSAGEEQDSGVICGDHQTNDYLDLRVHRMSSNYNTLLGEDLRLRNNNNSEEHNINSSPHNDSTNSPANMSSTDVLIKPGSNHFALASLFPFHTRNNVHEYLPHGMKQEQSDEDDDEESYILRREEAGDFMYSDKQQPLSLTTVPALTSLTNVTPQTPSHLDLPDQQTYVQDIHHHQSTYDHPASNLMHNGTR